MGMVGLLHTRPSLKVAAVDVNEVQHPSDALVGKVLHRVRPNVVRRHGRKDDAPVICDFEHIFQMSPRQWCLPGHHDQSSSLLERDVAGTGDEIVAIPCGNGTECFHAARHNKHTIDAK